MRIIECNIDKFGVICNKKFTFSPKLNCVFEENGCGKTTLCAFIKAMLYGIGDTRKTSLDENERRRYAPWSGGVAQGSLTFSVGERIYRVERSFGARPSEDTFALYDEKSGLISTDYTENLGCELFGIDADGYEQTVYLSERGLAPTGDNKSVSAKLSDLVGADGDIGVMDSAMKILESQRKFLQKKKGVSSAISDTQAALLAKREEIEALSAHEAALREAERRLNEISAELETIKAERGALMAMQAESAKREMYLGFEEKCKSLLSEIEREVAEKDAIIQKLGREIPEREYIDALRLDFAEAQKLLSPHSEEKESADEYRELSLLFAQESAEEDIASLSVAISDYRELSRIKETKEYAEIKEVFSKRIPKVEECDGAIASLTAMRRQGKSVGIISVLLALVTLPSVILGATLSPLFFALTGASVAVILALLLSGAIKQRRGRATAVRGAEELLASVSERNIPREDILTELVRMRSLIDKAEQLQSGKWNDAERILSSILYKYGKSGDDSISCAEALIRDYERYKMLRVREGVRLEGEEKERARATALLKGVKDAMGRLGIDFTGSFSEIYALLDRYRELSRSIIAKREEYTRYKTETTLDTTAPAPAKSGEEITERSAYLDTKSRELHAEAGVINLRIAELTRALSERGVLLSECEALEARLAAYEENLLVINKTKELLTKAKDNIQSKYLGKTVDSFNRYMEKISGALGAEYRLDTGFNITASEGGISHPAEAYSRGTRELYTLSARLALIDSLYEGERPFIILDDPFAYFDDKRLEGAKQVIRNLSLERQIIYLTCMKSRCV
ncbi:MAG: AAA family ATPase [Clostridia bacterium]|nr:AAA family ATPase [Clostridia bacterium]